MAKVLEIPGIRLSAPEHLEGVGRGQKREDRSGRTEAGGQKPRHVAVSQRDRFNVHLPVGDELLHIFYMEWGKKSILHTQALAPNFISTQRHRGAEVKIHLCVSLSLRSIIWRVSGRGYFLHNPGPLAQIFLQKRILISFICSCNNAKLWTKKDKDSEKPIDHGLPNYGLKKTRIRKETIDHGPTKPWTKTARHGPTTIDPSSK